LTELVRKIPDVEGKVLQTLAVAREILRQQTEMYKTRVNRIGHRIVSLVRPYVRPVKTGKQAKGTEFGAKGALTYVDGFLFLDFWKHEAYNEAEHVGRHLEAYRDRFGRLPPYFVADTKYGTRKNRTDLETLAVRPSFRPLGRKAQQRRDSWFKKK